MAVGACAAMGTMIGTFNYAGNVRTLSPAWGDLKRFGAAGFPHHNNICFAKLILFRLLPEQTGSPCLALSAKRGGRRSSSHERPQRRLWLRKEVCGRLQCGTSGCAESDMHVLESPTAKDDESGREGLISCAKVERSRIGLSMVGSGKWGGSGGSCSFPLQLSVIC